MNKYSTPRFANLPPAGVAPLIDTATSASAIPFVPPPPPRVFIPDRTGLTAGLRYRFTGPVRPVTGRNRSKTRLNLFEFKSRRSNGTDRYTGRTVRFTGRFDRYTGDVGGAAQTGKPAGYTGIPDGYTGIPDGYTGIPAGWTGIPVSFPSLEK